MAKETSYNLNSSFPFSWGAASDKGKVRTENQDSFLVEPEIGLFLVSDGMGGHRGGALASKIVAEDLPVMIETGLGKLKVRNRRTIRALFKKTITEQSRQLRMEGTSEAGYKDMGATVVIAMLYKGRAYIANSGDSRMYRLGKGKLTQLTKDHSVVSELLDKGKIEPEEAQNHSAAGEITHYIGMEEKVTPYVRTFMLKKADRFLLCTDGLTDMVSDKEIASILTSEENCQSVCEKLVGAANAAGGDDNITVVVMDWFGYR